MNTEFQPSNSRNVMLTIHDGLMFIGRIAMTPVNAFLNFFDKTPSFAAYLKQQKDKEETEAFLIHEGFGHLLAGSCGVCGAPWTNDHDCQA